MCGLFEYSRNDENKEDFFFFFFYGNGWNK